LNRAIAELAVGQHAIVEREQLRDLGVEDWVIEYRLSTGRLHAKHRGVYAVGHPLVTRKGVYMAAVLTAGPGAVVSHRSAADLWGLRPDNRPVVDIVPTRQRRSRKGIVMHDPHRFHADDTTTFDGIPVTSPMRTLVDLAPKVDVQGLARALRRADDNDLLDMRPLARLLAASPRGARALRALLRDYAEGPRQKSDLERLLRRICRANQLPLPQCNVLLHGHEVDFLWPDHKLIGEADSWLYHGNRHAFNRDRRRDADLATLHYRTVRFTDLQLEHEPDWVARTLAKLLR
jgi:very-short-patch-repair endonuclease